MVVKGQKINDRYEIVKILGEGGMANVYLAHDIILDRKVAVKVLRGDLAIDEKFVRRFQREALSASSLSHPNIVEVYDVGEDEGSFYIVMEYVEGKNLKQLIRKRGALTLPEVIDIMLQLTDGLGHAHNSYIIHRDIKPQNIMILDNGIVKITDFGIAMALNSSQLTQTNSVMGSVHYLPPEQAAGKGCTIKSDIYSLGILMYELLTGKLPFKGENAVEIALKHMRDPIPSVRKELSNIPQSIENIIIRSTAKNPKNRYNDAKEMYEDLKTALDKDRENESRYIYKHLENDMEDTKVLPIITDSNKSNQEEELIAKPIKDEDYKPEKKLVIILSTVFGVLLLLLLIIFFIIPSLTKVPDITIPDVSGLTVQKAEQKLQKLGFEVAVTTKETNSDTIDEGLIVKTSPAIGRSVKKGTTIVLYESIGLSSVLLEDYTGQKIIDVKASLISKGLTVSEEKKEVENITDYKDKEDIIIGQSVSAGTKVDIGSGITLYLPDVYDVYPDMVAEEWTLEEVQAFAEEYKLILSTEYQETSSYAAGKIISQSRAANSKIIANATFKITIAEAVSEETEGM
ncbi:MAG: Stk1 family PASTA domain-containing Ser/Thr kinase [Bacilli bacterium]|nr:Stk1 family PASTA domain-containing Ser/Thr kinase [Bacilli bacterium]